MWKAVSIQINLAGLGNGSSNLFNFLSESACYSNNKIKSCTKKFTQRLNPQLASEVKKTKDYHRRCVGGGGGKGGTSPPPFQIWGRGSMSVPPPPHLMQNKITAMLKLYKTFIIHQQISFLLNLSPPILSSYVSTTRYSCCLQGFNHHRNAFLTQDDTSSSVYFRIPVILLNPRWMNMVSF